MRCPDCNKFVSLELADEPEAELEVAEDGTVTGTVKIVRQCAECGTELKEASFDVDVTIPELIKHVDMHTDEREARAKARKEAEIAAEVAGTELPEEDDVEEPELEVEVDNAEGTEEGGGRYAKSYFGAHVTFTVTCSCKEGEDAPTFSGEFEDKIAASHMDELT